jgi:hypothetical protein
MRFAEQQYLRRRHHILSRLVGCGTQLRNQIRAIFRSITLCQKIAGTDRNWYFPAIRWAQCWPPNTSYREVLPRH